MPAPEGRGIGLVEKLKAYNLQDEGMDTIEANEALGHQADARSFDVAAEILRSLGMLEVRLLTNNPQKVKELEENGIRVEKREPVVIAPVKENEAYLAVKKAAMAALADRRHTFNEMACMNSMHTMAPTVPMA